MDKQAQSVDLAVELRDDFESAVERVTEALKSQGFGILTEIDVRATLKEKLDADFRPYLILGACNPPLAYKALTIDPEVGKFLPCNVTIDQVEDGLIKVSFLDPLMMSAFVDDPRIQPVAQDVRERLERVAVLLMEV
ncbi:MAG TPA: DUF302 domain-containing protein [Anaerolineae bacterium]|jgi:uncharacterized protein (DUF302 family)|nr:DUF302 domain-containing protein [Anaerolineae bacterium]